MGNDEKRERNAYVSNEKKARKLKTPFLHSKLKEDECKKGENKGKKRWHTTRYMRGRNKKERHGK